ncbi:rod-binding protein [Pontivivens insulae]|uniref:Flagellar protein FlgJ N-terminal domain-containing protein n=1 Tax=Pontivivens insulae TaxID=1639689 RepID=A0A2R8A9F2_9RHOB|nr:rod-binding protein [Pontivivens insulae]RED12758.1 rod binding protein [Pontivivens insulae]SPF28849.1 hypothetical protein POI8812_01152 [Pontivivens insulae]
MQVSPTSVVQDTPQIQRLRETAIRMEGAFLAEMLRHGGADRPRAELGGGAGEDAFSSMLAREQADHFARAGGIGLAEAIFEALKREV